MSRYYPILFSAYPAISSQISLSSTTPDEGQIEQYKAKIAQNIRLDWLLDAAHMQGADEVK